MRISGFLSSVFFIGILLGCITSWEIKFINKESGRVYTGLLKNGTMVIMIEGTEYQGRLIQGPYSGSQTTNQLSVKGLSIPIPLTSNDGNGAYSYYAILSSAGGQGLRYDGSGDNYTIRGTCVDSSGRNFDVTIARTSAGFP